MLEVSFGELAQRPVRARRQRAVLHHDADSLSRASTRPRPERAVYLVQREVAERIVAPPGDRGVRRAVGERAGRGDGRAAVPRRAAAPSSRRRSVESAVVRIDAARRSAVVRVGGGGDSARSCRPRSACVESRCAASCARSGISTRQAPSGYSMRRGSIRRAAGDAFACRLRALATRAVLGQATMTKGGTDLTDATDQTDRS